MPETNIGGASIGGNVESEGGDVAGRDKVEQKVTVNVERDSLDDLRTDIYFIKKEQEAERLAQFEIKLTQNAIQQAQALMQQSIEELRQQQASHVAQAGPPGDINENIVRVIAVVFSVLFAVAFILVLIVVWRAINGY